MKVRITARHCDPDAELRRHVEEKVSRLGRYFDRVDEAHVVLEADGHRWVAEVTVHASRTIVSSKQSSEDLRSAFDLAVDKVERQIRRHKDRVRNTKHADPTATASLRLGATEIGQIGIVPEDLASRPMTVEEALAELEESQARFLVFWNSETKDVSVIYSRDDGDFGLVEPEE
jgi:ribosome hibernation promoting factor